MVLHVVPVISINGTWQNYWWNHLIQSMLQSVCYEVCNYKSERGCSFLSSELLMRDILHLSHWFLQTLYVVMNMLVMKTANLLISVRLYIYWSLLNPILTGFHVLGSWNCTYNRLMWGGEPNHCVVKSSLQTWRWYDPCQFSVTKAIYLHLHRKSVKTCSYHQQASHSTGFLSVVALVALWCVPGASHVPLTSLKRKHIPFLLLGSYPVHCRKSQSIMISWD